MEIEFGNVQASVVHLYRCPFSRHLFFRFADRDGAKDFVRQVTPLVTMADFRFDDTPDPLLNLGVTFNGLTALGLDPALGKEFDAAYKRGPEAHRLGDAGRSAPEHWWEGRFATADVHAVVHLHVRGQDGLEPASAMVREIAARSGVTELTPRQDGTVLDGCSLGHGRVHFGYTDGIAHPDICWDDVPDTPDQVNFRNFLLGYATPDCSSAPEDGAAADLVRDSSYMAFRWIYQDVAAFNRFLAAEGPRLFPDLASADAEELLAAKMMGRWRDGTPLMLSPDRPDPALNRRNDFGYAADPDGRRCPFSAHMRVVNPRDQPLDPVAVEGVPRVLRRGMPYGPVLESTQDDGIDRGLIGMFFCADIRKQIYTLTAWIRQNDFAPVYAGNRRVQDPLVGNRSVPGIRAQFTIPRSGGHLTVTGLPDFMHTKGTLFLLHPSRSMLLRLA